MARKKILKPVQGSGLSFYGSPCTKDCSGHRAGWMWQQSHRGQTPIANRSFTAGANIRTAQGQVGINPIGPVIRSTQTGQYVKFKKK